MEIKEKSLVAVVIQTPDYQTALLFFAPREPFTLICNCGQRRKGTSETELHTSFDLLGTTTDFHDSGPRDRSHNRPLAGGLLPTLNETETGFIYLLLIFANKGQVRQVERYLYQSTFVRSQS